MNTLAIDIGGTKFSVALFSAGRMVRRETRATDRPGGPTWMLAQLGSILREWKAEISMDCCGIGFGGPVDYTGQRPFFSTHVEGWRNLDLAGHIGEILSVPVVIDNDANLGALGEALHGAGGGARPLFYMTLSTGIGGGLILEDGTIYRGADSYAAEIGHLTVQPGGPECLCGSHGCLERMCAGLWLECDYGKPAQVMLRDPVFTRCYVIPLAIGLKAALMLLNPARIVIGGGMAKSGDALFVPLREELLRQMPAWSRARVDVVPAALGDDSVLWGAFALAESSTLPASAIRSS